MPATLALTMGTPAAFGAFTPGVGKEYTARHHGHVISTAGDATLSVADPSATATGHLVNGTFSLNQALQAQASSPAAGLAKPFANVGGSASPTTLASWTNPVSNDPVAIGFKQTILASEAAAHGRLLEDAHVHALDHDSVVGEPCEAPAVHSHGRRFGV